MALLQTWRKQYGFWACMLLLACIGAPFFLSGCKPASEAAKDEFLLATTGILLLTLIIIVVAALWNRTLLKKIEQQTSAIARSESKYHSIFNNSVTGIYQTTPAGAIISINPAMARMLGYASPEEAKAQVANVETQVYVRAEQRQRHIELLRQQRRVENFECELYSKDQSVIWVVLNSYFVSDHDGNLLYIEGTCVDISARKKAELDLRKNRDMLEQLVEDRTSELSSANQELLALNQQMGEQIEFRRQIENELVLRDRQYRASVNLLTRTTSEIDLLLESILRDAIKLVKATGGYIGLTDESGKTYVVRYAIGTAENTILKSYSTDQGLFGQMAKSGEMLYVEDYRHYEHRNADALLERLTTMIMFPLRHDGRLVGAFNACWVDEVHAVSNEDLETLRQFGNLASLALERARTSAKITNQNQLLQGLAETTAVLVSELDMDTVLQSVLEKAAELMGIQHGFIQFFEQNNEEALIKFAIGRQVDQIGFRMRFGGEGMFAELLRTGGIVMAEDYHNWPKRLKGPFFDEITQSMQAPLKIDGKIIGSIGLNILGESVTIDNEKLPILEQFAIVTSIAIKNALAHQKITQMAFQDTLTGLPNRTHLNLRLEQELNKASRGEAFGAVLFIDMDDLKMINDNFGHNTGDSVIAKAGQYITGAVDPEAFVARMGGDEFIILLAGEDQREHIAQIADKVLTALHCEYEVGNQRIHMSASIGITLYPADADSTVDILKAADGAMYAAKAAGRNCWRFYEQSMLLEAYDKMVLTNSLRHALENDELYLAYQPQIELVTGKVLGFEALLRWNSKEHGQVSPARFISLAEQSGLIHPIGQWVFGEACRFARKLAKKGRQEIHVAVNVSPRQLSMENFVEIVHRSIAGADINPGQMEIEITENVLIESLEESIGKLVELSDFGVRLSLDDFGTGYSSLTYLRRLPVKTLKIDKTFIDSVLNDKAQEGFIKSIIDMAHVLELNVVAEGVETEAQMLKLTELSCDCVQGYLFSWPISEEEAILFLDK